VAKIAANYRLREKRKVALISTDTYRIAAMDQLRTYAEIIDLPLEIAATPREMRQGTARLADCDLVLIDTAGSSPRAPLQMQELKTLLQAAETQQTILVLSATCHAPHLVRVAQQFSPVECSSLILTKLDESHGPGGAWSFLQRCPLPLCYITDGQCVPEDIRDADADELVAMLFASSECG
jgi:flagellar biosynthesis protein FlhF